MPNLALMAAVVLTSLAISFGPLLAQDEMVSGDDSGESEAPAATTDEPRPTPLPSPSPTSTPEPSERYVFEDSVSAETRAEVTAGIERSKSFLAQSFGVSIPGAVTITVRASDSSFQTQGGYRFLNINAASRNWTEVPPWRRVQTLGHEYFHVAQYEWGNRTAGGPIWLVEGTAYWMGFYVSANAGGPTQEAALACFRSSVAKSPTLPALEAIETRSAFNVASGPTYFLGALAADSLLARPGTSALRSYWEQRPADATWAAAFAAAFNESPESFYARFGRARGNFAAATPDPCDSSVGRIL
jgi:hypothetical protein